MSLEQKLKSLSIQQPSSDSLQVDYSALNKQRKSVNSVLVTQDLQNREELLHIVTTDTDQIQKSSVGFSSEISTAPIADQRINDDIVATETEVKLIEKAISKQSTNHPQTPPNVGESASFYFQRMKFSLKKSNLAGVIGRDHPFWNSLCRAVFQSVDLRNLPIVTVMRIVLNQIQMPYEQREKERVLDVLAEEYQRQNSNTFGDLKLTQYLFYSVMHCHTLFHNAAAKRMMGKSAIEKQSIWTYLQDQFAVNGYRGCKLEDYFDESFIKLVQQELKTCSIQSGPVVSGDDPMSFLNYMQRTDVDHVNTKWPQVAYCNGNMIDVKVADGFQSLFDTDTLYQAAPLQHIMKRSVFNQEAIQRCYGMWENVYVMNQNLADHLTTYGFKLNTHLRGKPGLQSASATEQSNRKAVKLGTGLVAKDIQRLLEGAQSEHTTSGDQVWKKPYGSDKAYAPLLNTPDYSGTYYPEFSLAKSDISALYKLADSFQSKPWFNLALMFKSQQFNTVEERRTLPDCQFKSKVELLDSQHLLLDMIRQPDYLTGLQQYHEVVSDQYELILYSGPAMKKLQYEIVGTEVIKPRDRSWQAGLVLITAGSRQSQLKFFDKNQIGEVHKWFVEYQKLCSEYGFNLCPSTLDSMQMKAEDKSKLLKHLLSKMPRLPAPSQVIPLQNCCTYIDQSYEKIANALTFCVQATANKTQHYLLVTPDQSGVTAVTPTFNNSLESALSMNSRDKLQTLFAASSLQGVMFGTRFAQEMSKSKQVVTGKFTNSHKWHMEYIINMSSAASTVLKDTQSLLNECRGSFESLLHKIREFVQGNVVHGKRRVSAAVKSQSQVMDSGFWLQILSQSEDQKVKGLVESVLRAISCVNSKDSLKSAMALHNVLTSFMSANYNVLKTQQEKSIDILTRQLNQMEMSLQAMSDLSTLQSVSKQSRKCGDIDIDEVFDNIAAIGNSNINISAPSYQPGTANRRSRIATLNYQSALANNKVSGNGQNVAVVCHYRDERPTTAMSRASHVSMAMSMRSISSVVMMRSKVPTKDKIAKDIVKLEVKLDLARIELLRLEKQILVCDQVLQVLGSQA
ncbi:hypothetical protein MP228_009001 [Amoeboaphelidium protococcarum]|nr:hypothetical protein MP228_009001 [Amoeboaphelidium protococcarum]